MGIISDLNDTPTISNTNEDIDVKYALYSDLVDTLNKYRMENKIPCAPVMDILCILIAQNLRLAATGEDGGFDQVTYDQNKSTFRKHIEYVLDSIEKAPEEAVVARFK